MSVNYSDSTPVAPSGRLNAKFQGDSAGNISVNIPVPIDELTDWAANTFLAGPVSGIAGSGTRRTLVAADLPASIVSELVNAQTGTSYTVVSGDLNKLVTFSNASAVAVTLPQATGSFFSGWYADIRNEGAGDVTITPTTSTIGGNATLVLKQDQGARVVSDGTNYGIFALNVTNLAASGPGGVVGTLPISTGVSGLGTGVGTFLATPSSANLAAALTDETGSGAAVFATSPILVTPALGTPSSGDLTNCTLPAQPVMIPSGVPGKPGASATVLLFTATQTINFGANFADSQGTVGANPTSSAAYTVLKNGSSIGTVTVSTGGAFTFATSGGSAESLSAGDRLTVTAPSSQDATLSDVAFTLAGTR